MYEFRSRIGFSEADENGYLKLEALLDYFQDCSTFHGEDSAMGVRAMEERGQVWVLSSWQIVVSRYPRMGERVVIGTAPHGFKGFFGYRNYLLSTEEGEQLACANTIWTLMDLKKGCPVRADQSMLDAYTLEPPLEMEYAPRKITPAEGHREQKAPIVITHSHLDMNHHVNNGQYVRMAMEYLPDRSKVYQMRTEYKKETVLGEVLYPVCCQEESGVFQVEFQDAGGEIRCIVACYSITE